MEWSKKELKILDDLDSPEKVQVYLDRLAYNPKNEVSSPRIVMRTKKAHCLEGCLLAAAALEHHGHRPLLINLLAHNDDHHVLAVYKTKTGWGSVSKSNTALLAGRLPYYKNIRELVMSYFDFYFNTKREYSLLAYSQLISLKRYQKWQWQTTEEDLWDLGVLFTEVPHHKILNLRELKKIP